MIIAVAVVIWMWPVCMPAAVCPHVLLKCREGTLDVSRFPGLDHALQRREVLSKSCLRIRQRALRTDAD